MCPPKHVTGNNFILHKALVWLVIQVLVRSYLVPESAQRTCHVIWPLEDLVLCLGVVSYIPSKLGIFFNSILYSQGVYILWYDFL